jgi:hypothetical protein
MQPDGTTLSSTSEAKLTMTLPQHIQAATEGHVLPQLHKHSIMSLGKLCDAGCTCTLTQHNAVITYQGSTVMEGIRKENGLWYLVTDKSAKNSPTNQAGYQTRSDVNSLTNVYQAKRIKEAMQFLHAALWSPAKATLLQAIKAEFFASWPLLTAKNASKHLEETMATHKGHLKRTKQNIRSTRPAISNIKMEPEDDQFHKK